MDSLIFKVLFKLINIILLSIIVGFFVYKETGFVTAYSVGFILFMLGIHDLNLMLERIKKELNEQRERLQKD